MKGLAEGLVESAAFLELSGAADISLLRDHRVGLARAGFQRLLALLVISLLVAGCASGGGRSPAGTLPPTGGEGRDEGVRFTASRSEPVRQGPRTLAELLPPQYRATHRAILTVGRKQFVCDGHLTVSPNGGGHLAVVSPLGLVAEVRVRPDGTRELLKVTPLLRAAWSRDFLARDLQWLFLPPGELRSVGRLADGRPVFEKAPGADGVRARYLFSAGGDQWQALELWRSGRRFYRATPGSFRQFAGWPVACPSEIEVQAESYRLHLRLVELRVAAEVGL